MDRDMDASGEDLARGDFEASHLLNPLAMTKSGDDPIFNWFSRFISARDSGEDVINGTLGSLLDDDGELAVNRTVDEHIRRQPSHEMCGYAPLRGLPEFRELAIDLALGPSRQSLQDMGIHQMAIATPGGCGALSASIANFLDRGDDLLLRSRHWGPYGTIIRERDCGFITWPMLPEAPVSGLEHLDRRGLSMALDDLAQRQDRVLIWLNDPAHNPTGLSLRATERRAVLEDVWGYADAHPQTGFTLLIDAAYALYAAEPHGWADTMREAVAGKGRWPNNFQVAVAVSCSKSHTVYGLRTGALVVLHPQPHHIERLEEVLLHTGRGTWSAAPRVSQRAISEVHADEMLLSCWTAERDGFKRMIDERRDALRQAAVAHGLTLNPTHDGYFAFLECEDPVGVCEVAATQGVYLVPLEGGVRIGICAIAADRMERVASALADGLASLRD